MGTNLATASTNCPFCKGAVPADTLRFGGNCPHCMLEIPGEEAPTDPGKLARLRAEVEAQKQRKATRRRNAVLGVVATLVLSVAGAGGYWQYQKQQEALVIELDDFYMVPLDQLQGAPAQPEAAPVQEDGKAPATQKRRVGAGGADRAVSPQAVQAAPEGSGALAPAMKGPSGSTSGGDALPAELQNKGSTAASGSFGEANIGVDRVTFDTKVLTDETEIYEMAKRVINGASPQLQSCYNQRLKQVEGLSGAWKLAFSIGRDGLTKNVTVTGTTTQDAELEQCMVRAVQGWKFQKIAKDQPVMKTYRFGAQGY